MMLHNDIFARKYLLLLIIFINFMNFIVKKVFIIKKKKSQSTHDIKNRIRTEIQFELLKKQTNQSVLIKDSPSVDACLDTIVYLKKKKIPKK